MILLQPLVAALGCAMCWSAITLNAADRQPGDVLKKNWVSLKLAFTLHDNDFHGTGPVALLERLPDKRILLSYVGFENWEGKPPRPVRHISDAEFSRIAEQAHAIWQKAQSDVSEGERVSKLPLKEQIEVRRKARGDLSISRMQIEFKATGPEERCEFEKALSTSRDAWLGFLSELGGAPPP